MASDKSQSSTVGQYISGVFPDSSEINVRMLVDGNVWFGGGTLSLGSGGVGWASIKNPITSGIDCIITRVRLWGTAIGNIDFVQATDSSSSTGASIFQPNGYYSGTSPNAIVGLTTTSSPFTNAQSIGLAAQSQPQAPYEFDVPVIIPPSGVIGMTITAPSSLTGTNTYYLSFAWTETKVTA